MRIRARQNLHGAALSGANRASVVGTETLTNSPSVATIAMTPETGARSEH